MVMPTVTELELRPEPVTRDTFIADPGDLCASPDTPDRHEPATDEKEDFPVMPPS